VDRRFPLELETATYRVTQEALTNVARHARVQAATLRLWATGKSLCVEVEDNGDGFEVVTDTSENARHWTGGLSGMRERVELLGGSLTVDAAPKEGTRITAVLPLMGDPALSGEPGTS